MTVTFFTRACVGVVVVVQHTATPSNRRGRAAWLEAKKVDRCSRSLVFVWCGRLEKAGGGKFLDPKRYSFSRVG